MAALRARDHFFVRQMVLQIPTLLPRFGRHGCESEDLLWTIQLSGDGRERYAPEFNKRIRPHLKLAGASYRIDETYVKVGTQWKYLYRALDKEGNTIEFMQERKARHYCSKTLLQEDDEGRSSQTPVLDLCRQACLLS